jgi:hypothetical protein
MCFEEGFKLYDSVVYIDCDCRIFYKTYKNCYTNFFKIIEPGFHRSWVWGKVIREDGGFFISNDVRGRVKGYGELALSLSNKLNIPIDEADHHQEGVIIISKEGGKENILLETWKKLSSPLDDFEIENGSKKIGVGEGNLLGLSIAKSQMSVHGPEIANSFGQDIKYNFYKGSQMEYYLKEFPGRKIVKFSDGELIKPEKLISVNFKDKKVDLTYKLHRSVDNVITLTFEWNTNNSVEFLDHEFKINETVYHFNSNKNGDLLFEGKSNIKIYHTYDWYGERDWKLIDEI